jgi:hypothetical protein
MAQFDLDKVRQNIFSNRFPTPKIYAYFIYEILYNETLKP